MQAFYRRPIALAAFLAVMTALVSYRMHAAVKPWLLVTIGVLFALLLLMAILKRGGRRTVEALICLFAIAVSLAASHHFFDVRYRSYKALAGETVEVEGTVLERVSSSSFLTTFRVSLDRLNGEEIKADAMIECRYSSAMQVGDTFLIRGEVRKFEKDELFDEEVFRLSDGCMMTVTCYTRKDCDIGAPNQKSLRVIASQINERLSYALAGRIGGQEGALTAALLLGNRSLLSGQTKLAFQYAGISHLLALSGLHVSILIAFVEFLLRSMFIGKQGRAAIIPFFALGYLTLTGFSPSTCRAVLMALVMYLAVLFGERYDSFTALMLSLFFTLTVTPYAILDLSLWMSYLAAAAIVLIYPLVSLSFEEWYQKRKPPLVLFRAVRSLVSAVVIGVSANLALMLLSAFVFGTTSLASVPATMLLSLPITALLILAFLSVLLGFITPLPMLCGVVSECVLWVADLFAGIDGVLLPLNDAYCIAVLTVMTVVMIVIALIKLRHLGWLFAPPLLFVLAVCISFYVTANVFSQQRLTKFESGHGELRLYTESGHAVLINDLEGTGSKAYEIKQAAIADRCTVVEELVFCHYYNQAPFFIASLSESIYVRCLHLPDPKDEREVAIAKRIADEADFYGIELRFDAAELIERYDGQNINDDLTFSN